eukprot:UN02036
MMLTIQFVLHIVLMSRDTKNETLLDRNEYHSLRQIHAELVSENVIFFINGFVIPLKILQYCTDLSDDFRWFREFTLVAKSKVCTFFHGIICICICIRSFGLVAVW